jgi:hypothetical protein
VITFLSPGLRFFHQGQFEGRKKRISPHLIRVAQEPTDVTLQKFYNELLAVLKKPLFRGGHWRLLECKPAWNGNETWDSFLAFAWEETGSQRSLVIVNYSPQGGQCFVPLPYEDFSGQTVRLKDMMSSASYDRDGSELLSGGLFLDMTAWGYHIFEVSVAAKSSVN